MLPQAADVAALRERLQAAGIAHEARDGTVVVDDPFAITMHVVAADAPS